MNEGVASQVDIGYHYPNVQAAPAVSAANSIVSPLIFDENPNSGGTPVVITITPRNGSSQVIGAGLVVTATATDVNNLGPVSDLGDGSYQVTYTIPIGTASDSVSFTVNAVTLDSTTDITWTAP